MTQNHIYDLAPRVGRKKEYPNRLTLPLSDDMLAGVDEVRDDGEDRLSAIREAIDEMIKTRRRKKKAERKISSD